MSTLTVRVVPKEALDHSADAPTRGFAHLGFDDHPPGAPGHLDFGPLVLCGVGELYPGEGFPMHRHENVENLLFVRSGRCRHADSDGRELVVGPGDLAVMSAGTGMEHSEFVEGDDDLHAIVLHIRPDRRDTAPTFEVIRPPSAKGRLGLVASGREGTVGVPRMQVDAEVRRGILSAGDVVTHALEAGRMAYVLVLDGMATVGGQVVDTGGRALVGGRGEVEIAARDAVEIVLIDLGSAR
jgi:hypothetical protein